MSFVGPRPERPQFVADLEARLPYYAERHVVKPGITGWAQINYPYGASIEDAREKLEYDLYYAKNYTPVPGPPDPPPDRARGDLAGGRAMIAVHRPVEPFARRRALRRARDLSAAPAGTAIRRTGRWSPPSRRCRSGRSSWPCSAPTICSPSSPRARATSPSSPSCTGSWPAPTSRASQRAVKGVFAAVAGVIGLQIVIGGVMPEFQHAPMVLAALASTSQIIGLTIAAGALILVHNLYGQAAPGSRPALRFPMLALAAMWAYDLHLYTVAYFTRAPGSELFALARARAGGARRPVRPRHAQRRAGRSSSRAPPPSSRSRWSPSSPI